MHAQAEPAPAIFDLLSGTYDGQRYTKLSSGTPSAEIRYTKDGSDVTLSSPVYTGSILIDKSMVIKAKAYVGTDSSVQSSGTYVITVQPAIFSLISGSYGSFQSTTLSCGTPGAIIRYTTNGSEVTPGSTIYTNAIAIDRGMLIKAKAYSGQAVSVPSSGTYTIDVKPAIFSLISGTYVGSQSTSLDSATPNAVIRFTTNGDDVSANSPQYTGTININQSMTIKAKSFLGVNQSVQSSGSYTIGPVQPAIFSLVSNAYNGPQTVELSSATQGSVIRYTEDGSDVTNSSLRYTGPITINRNVVIKAKSFLGVYSSVQSSGTYTILYPAIFSLISGTYTGQQSTRLDTATQNSVIRYTTNGTNVTPSSTLYTGPITIDKSMTIKAKAYVGSAGSVQSSGTYEIEPVREAIFSLISGAYVGEQITTLSSATKNAIIRYSTDGSDVTPSSNLYTGPIVVDRNLYIKAKTFLGEMTSVQSSGTYTIKYKVTASAGTGGSITPSDTDVVSGEKATFTATALSGYQINKIEGCGTSSTISSFVTQAINSTCHVDATFTPIQSVATPVISPNGGSHNSLVNVCLSTTTAGAEIRYSTDGSDIAATSTLYSDCFTLNSSATVKAKAFKTGMTASVLSSASFEVGASGPVEYIYNTNGQLLRTETKN